MMVKSKKSVDNTFILLIIIALILFATKFNYKDSQAVRVVPTYYQQEPLNQQQSNLQQGGGASAIIKCGSSREYDGESPKDFHPYGSPFPIGSVTQKYIDMMLQSLNAKFCVNKVIVEDRKKHCKGAKNNADEKCEGTLCEYTQCPREVKEAECKDFCEAELKPLSGNQGQFGVNVWAYASKNNAGKKCSVKCDEKPQGPAPTSGSGLVQGTQLYGMY
mgnify:CR=1 FL=1